MVKHPINRAERLKINEKKSEAQPRPSKLKRRIKEFIKEQEAEDAIQSLRKSSPDLDG